MSRILRNVLLVVAALTPGLPAGATGQAEAYDSYPAPAACVAAAQRLMLRTTWEYPFDTLPFNPNRRVPEAARSAGAACLGKTLPGGLSIGAAQDRDVAALFSLARAFGDDTLARQAWTRGLGQQRIRDDSTDVIWALLGSYAYGSPPDLAVARRMAAWLDTLGVIGERPLVPYDSMWVSQHNPSDELAQSVFDTAAMRGELDGVRRNYDQLESKTGAERTTVAAHAEDLLLALVRNPRDDSAVARFRSKAIEILGPDHEERYGGGLLLLGRPFGPLHPDFSFGPGAGDSLRPRPGRVTLVQFVNPLNCLCDGPNAIVHRLKARFGDSLDFVFVTQTAGRFDRRVQLPPQEEARLLARRVHEQWKLQGTVAIYRTTFVPNPAPDNRLVAQKIPELQHVRYVYAPMIVDKRGIFVLSGFSPTEAAMVRLIERLLEAPA